MLVNNGSYYEVWVTPSIIFFAFQKLKETGWKIQTLNDKHKAVKLCDTWQRSGYFPTLVEYKNK